MSREIKFRAWDKEVKAMHYPQFWMQNKGGQPCVKLDDGRFGYHGSSMELMQYTGLKDKNGVEIYEGDILAGEDGEWQDNDETWVRYIAGIVTWWDDNARWFLSDDLEGYMGDDDKADEPMDWNKYEVIGNIYENPELLK